MYEDICLENIKKLYKSSVKCDEKQKYKAILEADIVSTPGELTENIPMDVGMLGNMKNPNEINPPSEVLKLLDVTQKTAVQNGSCKNNHKAYIQTVLYGTVLIRGRDIKKSS